MTERMPRQHTQQTKDSTTHTKTNDTTTTTTTHPHHTPTIPTDDGDGHDGRASSSRRHCCGAGLPGMSINVAVLRSPSLNRRQPEKRSRVYRQPPERDQGIAAAVTAALVQWALPLMSGVQAGAALDTSDREGVHTACRSITAPWAIERAQRARRQRRRGGEDHRGGGGQGEMAGKPLLVGLRPRWTTMVRMTLESGGTKQQPTP
jgi:hypothetical protein